MSDWLTGFARSVSAVFDVLGVGVIVGGAAVAAAGAWRARARPRLAYDRVRRLFGKAVLLGLEVLVAADIIRTVAVAPTLRGLAALGLLVLVRTFLSWSLDVELEGLWPWQKRRTEDQEALAGLRERPAAEEAD